MNLVNRSESVNFKGNPAPTPNPATTHHRESSLVLEDKVKVINRINNFPHTPQQSQHFNQQKQHTPNQQQNRSAPVRSNNPITPVHLNGCFRCGELGHYAKICPTRNMQTQIQKNSGQRTSQQSSQVRNGNLNSQGNKGSTKLRAWSSESCDSGDSSRRSKCCARYVSCQFRTCTSFMRMKLRGKEKMSLSQSFLSSPIFPNLEDEILFRGGRVCNTRILKLIEIKKKSNDVCV